MHFARIHRERQAVQNLAFLDTDLQIFDFE
jgi:hypothetical protein